MTTQRYQFNAKPIKMLSFPSVAEAYRPDPPSPAGVNFYYLQAHEEEYQTSGFVGEENLCNAVEFTSHFKTLYTITRHSNANVDLKYFCFL